MTLALAAPAAAQTQPSSQTTPPRFVEPPLSSPRRRSRRTSRRFRSASRPSRKTTIDDAGIHVVSEAAHLRAQHLLHRVVGPEAEQRAVPRHRLEPEQPRHHDLHRRRAAAERELVEHRAARRRPDRVRPRSAERAVRPQHARRPRQHHERAAVAVRRGRATCHGAVRQLRRVGRSRRRVRARRRATSSASAVSFAQVDRDGFTVNDVTGNDIDYALGVLRQGAAAVDAEQRLGERASSSPASARATATTRSTIVGALCARIRFMPRATSRAAPIATSSARRSWRGASGGPVAFSSTTGFVQLEDAGRHRPRLHAAAAHHARQHREGFPVHAGDSFRVGRRPLRVQLDGCAQLRWQSGVFLFTQAYEQDAINSYAPFVFGADSRRASTRPVRRSTTSASACSARPRSPSASAGPGRRRAVRLRETRARCSKTSSSRRSLPPRCVEADESFSNVSPQVSLAYAFSRDKTLYATVAAATRPAASIRRRPPAARRTARRHLERRRRREDALGRRPGLGEAAVFYIDWDDLQLNIPNPAVPAQFYIANVGGAASKGVEFEVGARAGAGHRPVHVIGYTHARSPRAASRAASTSRATRSRTRPSTRPARACSNSRVFGRRRSGRAPTPSSTALPVQRSEFARAGAYSLVNLRLGVTGPISHRRAARSERLRHPVHPLAFPYPNFAPSGFHGRDGRSPDRQREPRCAFLSGGRTPRAISTWRSVRLQADLVKSG